MSGPEPGEWKPRRGLKRRYKDGDDVPDNGQFKKLTLNRLRRVLSRLADFCECNEEDGQYFVNLIETMLDDAGDVFGTEGQLDPRGDRRG